jgi:hypothetical protein
VLPEIEWPPPACLGTGLALGGARARARYEDNRTAEDHQQQRIPYNYLNQEYLAVILFEVAVVFSSLVVQNLYLIGSYSMYDQPGLPLEEREGSYLEHVSWVSVGLGVSWMSVGLGVSWGSAILSNTWVVFESTPS